MKPKIVFRLAAAGPTAAIAVWLAGCATTHEVKISSVCRTTAANRSVASYDVRSRGHVPEDDSLRYQEATRHIKTALSSRGLYEVPPGVSPDMVVEIDYEMTAPGVKYDRTSRPVFGTVPPGQGALGRSTMDPTKEVVGYEDVTYPVLVREKRLSVCGRENAPGVEGRPPEEFWRVDVTIEDESHDLRGYLPILAAAAMDEIGRHRDGVVTAKVRASDDGVQFIKKGM